MYTRGSLVFTYTYIGTLAIRYNRMGHIITGSHKRASWQVVVHCEFFGQ